MSATTVAPHRVPADPVAAERMSCLYRGVLSHRRLAPRLRSFRHPIELIYIDLDELPKLLGGRLVSSRPGLLRFRRRDYHGDQSVPLESAVRDTVQRELGRRPPGPIRLLTHLRSCGYCFNPVSFYYCFAEDGTTVDAVLAEVTNTPWGERHAYVIDGETAALHKEMHVSPFMEMDQTYECRAPAPADRLSVAIDSRQHGSIVFEASMALRRQELTPGSTRRMLLRYPFATGRLLALIYAHAIAIRLSGIRIVPHPAGSQG